MRPPQDPDSERAREANRKVCALFDRCRDAGGARGARDAALLSVLFGCGVSRATAVSLRRKAYDADTGVLEHPGSAPSDAPPPVRRRCILGAREALAEWLRARGDWDGPLFCGLDEDGRPRPEPLEPDDVGRILDRRARQAGLTDYSVTDFRQLYRSPWWEAAPGRPSL